MMYWFVLPSAFPTFRHRAVERVAGRCHSYFVDRVADCALIVRRYSQHKAPIVMKDPLDFTGKVVLVTGSSRGIGAEMIKAFGTRGAQCVVNYVADPQGQNKADANRSRRN